ncbi:MAG: GNAT family N-acetyltransferase [Chitinophagia bacterium]|nr:GNAT family N-acetyltransferase [Chitinophagia bacterium]
MDTQIEIRPIEPGDNIAIAAIIRSVLEEFGANKPGTVYFDPETDHLYELFSNTPGSIYRVATFQGKLLGGAGIFPTPALPDGTCELVKMYLLPEARGKGVGKALMEEAFSQAKNMGYTMIYIETMPELTRAIGLYEKLGFEYLNGPMGNSGHCGCDIWMLKKLT